MNFEEIEQLVIKWAEDRAIFTGSTDVKQVLKLQEEFFELSEAVHKKDFIEIEDGIGDMIVVLALIAKFNDTTLSNCLERAYHQIKDRRGKMINGIFVKES